MSCTGHWFFGALLGLSLFASEARAQTNAALAETLFQEGKRLMAEKNYAEACPKLQESQRLDPGTGTLLNWGLCLKELGKPASAWVVFNQAVASARAENRAERVTLAQGEIEKLNAIMPRVAVVVPTDSDAPGLVVTLDGATISAATRGIATPVDPGDHVVKATAPQRKTWTTTLSVPAAAQTHNVVVPVLELGSDQAPPPSGGIQVAGSGQTTEEPAEKQRRWVFGLRLNGSIPAGYLADAPTLPGSGKLSGYSKAQGTLWLEAGYRIRPELMLGLYLSAGSGGVGSALQGSVECGADGSSCSSVDARLGLEGIYHFGAKNLRPWLGAGFGFEVMTLGPAGETIDFSGAEWLLLQGGLDFVIKQVQTGPFLSVSFARFTNGSCSDCDETEFTLKDPAFHEWIMLGVRGTIAL